MTKIVQDFVIFFIYFIMLWKTQRNVAFLCLFFFPLWKSNSSHQRYESVHSCSQSVSVQPWNQIKTKSHFTYSNAIIMQWMEFFVHTLCIMHPVLKQRMSISHSYITAHTHTNTHRLSGCLGGKIARSRKKSGEENRNRHKLDLKKTQQHDSVFPPQFFFLFVW